jgi:TolB-like protein/Tfp pilus assembly protein PilF
MSPEQAAGDGEVDGRSDLYSLACVLYEMLAGQAPFTGPTPESVVYQHLTVDPLPITNLRPAVPAEIVGVLNRGLAKNRADRFSPAAQFAEALKLATVPAAVQVSGAGLEAARAAALADPTLDRPRRIESIAVLPFVDLSPERDQEYFVDGMTDALISKLARVSGLRVISRTSVMRFRRTERPLPEIANELRVQALVEGSALRVGNRVRIVAQLIDAATDDHLWAESYEGDLSDILALQSDVAVAAAREIKTTLSPDDEANLSVHRQVDPEAYTLYLKGRHAWNRRTREGFDVAEECFKAAIERDPGSALAYSGLADTYVVQMFYQYMHAREVLPKAKAAAEKAIELDDRLAEAHASLAWALLWEWDFQGSEHSFERALELDPNNYANARHWYANLLVFSGRKEEAVAEMRRAVNLDPLSAPISNSLGWVLYVIGEYDAGIEQLKLTLTLDPSFSNCHLLLSLAWLEKGEVERALQSVERALELDPENLELPTFHAYVLARAGQKEQALSTLEAARERREMPARIAIVYAALGDRDAAFEWLERAYQEHRETLLNLKLYPWFDPLRSDTRFRVLLERLGFR